MKDILDYILAVIALAIFIFLIKEHKADWLLIAIYWGTVSVRNAVVSFTSRKEKKDD